MTHTHTHTLMQCASNVSRLFSRSTCTNRHTTSFCRYCIDTIFSLFQSRNNVVQVRGCVIICWSNENLKAKSEILIQFFWQTDTDSKRYCHFEIEIGDNSLFFPVLTLAQIRSGSIELCAYMVKAEASNGNSRNETSVCHFTYCLNALTHTRHQFLVRLLLVNKIIITEKAVHFQQLTCVTPIAIVGPLN